jgi:hypothetical protein
MLVRNRREMAFVRLGMLINNLIRIYFHVCDKYKEQLRWEVQRFSNNSQPADMITGEELMTIYVFCVA